MLREFGVHPDRLRATFKEPESPTGHNATGNEPDDAWASVSFDRQLKNAAECARTFGHNFTGTEHLALSLLAETNGDAALLIEHLGVDPNSVRDVLAERTRELTLAGRRRGWKPVEKTTNDDTLDEQLENRLRFLRQANTEGMPHSDCGLLDHLLGTRRLLVEWKARPVLCDAGLFHSIYSTDHYELRAIPLSMRDEVRQLIGDEAESLVWLFCMMRRETLYQNLDKGTDFSVQHRLTGERIPLTDGQFRDLVTMSYANCLEAFPRCPWNDRRNIRRGLRDFRNYAIKPAQSELDRIEARWWEFWK